MSLQLDSNPLREGLTRDRVIDPCIFVAFGGTGDLARRKLMPALYHLYRGGFLPRGFAVVAYAGGELTDEQYRESIRQAIAVASPFLPAQGAEWEEFAALLYYVSRQDDASRSLTALKSRLESVSAMIGAEGNYLFYLATPPSTFIETVEGLGRVGLAGASPNDGWRRLVIEKPFGTDLVSARELNQSLSEVFREDQIYRIDHYLGKETVQNILAFRFANEFVEPLLSSSYVDSVQITVAESIGVETRGSFYDRTGALRDIVQNHVLQILSLVCMEPPVSLAADDVRNEKMKVFSSVRRIRPDEVNHYTVRGQYSAGMLLGERVTGYTEEDNVASDSHTETFVAAKLYVDTWRWSGVPFYIRTGKRLAKRVTEIAIQLKSVPRALFGDAHKDLSSPNIIALNIQPDEGIAILFDVKVPTLGSRIQPVRMDFRYGEAFGVTAPDAYERLVMDAMLGDASLFSRSDAIEETWGIVQPVLDGWRELDSRPHAYLPGSWGPPEAEEFMRRDGRKWRRL